MQGRVVALNCGVYSVLNNEQIFSCSARGILRTKIKPVVGDLVEFNEKELVIDSLLERVSYLKRPVIANIDQMLIVQSLIEPDFSYLLAFKYLTYANMNGIKAKIIITKSDKKHDNALLEEIQSAFKTINIDTYIVSNKTKEGLDEVKNLFKGKVSCLIGQTGAGKSSLINAIDPNFQRKVGEYSNALHRGKHQTKEVILLPYEGGFIADTPGFSSLDLELFKEDLAQYFPSFEEYTKCYYSNCLHISENKCFIKKKVEEGLIPQIAYDCYLKLSNEAILRNQRYYK